MGIFSSISNAIFGRRAQARPSAAPAAPFNPGGFGGAVASGVGQGVEDQQADGGINAGMVTGESVDVEEVLEEISREKGNPRLNYKSSIVDLMTLLDLDSSLDNRKELATELGYTGEKNGSAEMNTWLHRKVMEGLEANGGRVPQSMKD